VRLKHDSLLAQQTHSRSDGVVGFIHRLLCETG
jgi:hypothetical protein